MNITAVSAVARHSEASDCVILCQTDARRKVGRPRITLKNVLEDDTGLEAEEILTVMFDR